VNIAMKVKNYKRGGTI